MDEVTVAVAVIRWPSPWKLMVRCVTSVLTIEILRQVRCLVYISFCSIDGRYFVPVSELSQPFGVAGLNRREASSFVVANACSGELLPWGSSFN